MFCPLVSKLTIELDRARTKILILDSEKKELEQRNAIQNSKLEILERKLNERLHQSMVSPSSTSTVEPPAASAPSPTLSPCSGCCSSTTRTCSCCVRPCHKSSCHSPPCQCRACPGGPSSFRQPHIETLDLITSKVESLAKQVADVLKKEISKNASTQVHAPADPEHLPAKETNQAAADPESLNPAQESTETDCPSDMSVASIEESGTITDDDKEQPAMSLNSQNPTTQL